MRKLFALLAPLLLLLPAACSGGVADDGVVVVLGPWLDDPASTTDESDVFRELLRSYGEKHGVTISYQGTRAIGQALGSKVKDGTLPDIAILPNVGELAAYATEDLAHPITDLPLQPPAASGVVLDHRALWRGSDVYAVAVKTDLKSLILYDPTAGPLRQPPTWAALLEQSRTRGADPWCLGLGAASAPGWPGTDWIEDLLLHQAGAAGYERWASGEMEWDSPELEAAWTAWAPVVQAASQDPLLTSPAEAARRLFDGDCALLHQSSFFAGGRGDFVSFPAGGDLEVSGDFAALFSTDPAARDLLRHLAGHTDWVRLSQGSVLPVDPKPEEYGPLTRRVAQRLIDAPRRCLDASDAMPATMAAAFHHAVLEFVADPGKLESILARLETVRKSVPREEWLPVRCAA